MNFSVGSNIPSATRERNDKEDETEQSKSRSSGLGFGLTQPTSESSKSNNLGFNFEFSSSSNFGEDWLSMTSEKQDSNKRSSNFVDFSEFSPTPRKRPNSGQVDKTESQILSAVREIKEETITFIEKEEEMKEKLREKADVILDVLKKK
ncbi:DgyrCDS476 [Dimorphilus gyrociliatus]|uniref:DgyrCDS476 n=1 Tax=Dimorphilus gyrociliatus TaxID=2664684 RepID=A0A7I8V7H2_9ANNE|nr:DgyrCDS476 [Dimorphilus gyrociliatus]